MFFIMYLGIRRSRLLILAVFFLPGIIIRVFSRGHVSDVLLTRNSGTRGLVFEDPLFGQKPGTGGDGILILKSRVDLLPRVSIDFRKTTPVAD